MRARLSSESCDPATLARDLALLTSYRIETSDACWGKWAALPNVRILNNSVAGAADYARCSGCATLFLDPLPSGEALANAYRAGQVDPLGPPAPREPALLPLPRALLRLLSRALRGRPHSWPEEEGRGRRLLDGLDLKHLKPHRALEYRTVL